MDEVVGERAAVPGLDDARVGERLEVMGQCRLRDTEQRQQLPCAEFARMPGQHVDEPYADRLAQRLRIPCETRTAGSIDRREEVGAGC